MSSLRLALKQSLSEAPSTKSSKKKKNKFIYTPTPFGLSDKELRRLEKQRKADDKAKDHLSKKEDDGEDDGVEKRLKKKIQRRKEKERLKKKLKEERKLKVCSFDIYIIVIVLLGFVGEYLGGRL